MSQKKRRNSVANAPMANSNTTITTDITKLRRRKSEIVTAEATTANKEAPKGNGTIAFPNADFLQNMSNAELTMIHRLAGNDPEIRKTTIRKLRKWLKAISRKVPDSKESKQLINSNFGRVWKALFYCMWMADKPIPQETLAEQISSFVTIFSEKPNVMILFVEWFFITFAREWAWIDRLRMDKYMMLIRRFIRKMFQEFNNRNWEEENLNSFMNIISIHLLNHHPPISKSSQRKLKIPDPPKAPLGFQIHIIDIFLEELAKVGGDTLQSGQILKILNVFVEEMRKNDDFRLLDEIKERIFHHLMKQSDVGIDYIESKGGALELVPADDEEDVDDVDECEIDQLKKLPNVPLDPRAGAVDVVLPQLKLNYDDLIQTLKSAALKEDTRAKNKKRLLSLAEEFRILQKGEYPLGSKREGSRIPAIKRSEIDAAAQKLIEMEESLKEPKSKRKKNKETELKFQQVSELFESMESEEDDSNFLNDSDLMNKVTENYEGYLGQMQNGEKGKSNSAKKNKRKSLGNQNTELASTGNSPSTKNVKKARRKAKSLGLSSTPVMAAATLTLAPLSLSPKTAVAVPTSKRTPQKPAPLAVPRKSSTSAESSPNSIKKENDNKPKSGDTFITIKRKRRMSEPISASGLETPTKIQKQLSPSDVMNIYSPLVTTLRQKNKEISPTQKLRRKSGIFESKMAKNSPTLKSLSSVSTPTSSGKKRVNFVLTKNLEHPHADYEVSIQRSPAIPYDGTKRPSFGLLKTKSPATPILLSPRKLLLSSSLSATTTPPTKSTYPLQRKKALDFFTDFD